ncbi:MAG: ATP-binding cassette domain-containing protein [Sporolactobacillus sp.]
MKEFSNGQPKQIEVIGGSVNNLKSINVNIPLHRFVAISGRSGSGKSSLAMGILYAEGSRRYLEALSTYTRRRISQSSKAQVQEVRHIPSALALKQRPKVPSVRSTVGTMTEIFNVVRLIFSRLGSTCCPNGHRIPPTLKIAQAMDLPSGSDRRPGEMTCPTCGIKFMAPGAEDFAFNSGGACPECQGLGQIKELDPETLIADENKTIREGAVSSWRLPGRNFMPIVAETIGVRIDVPFKELTEREKEIVFHGEKKKYPVDFTAGTGRVFHTEKTLYENAYQAIYDSMNTTKSDRAIARLNQFFHFSTCPTCHGTRLDPKLLQQLVGGQNIAQVSDLTLGSLKEWQEKAESQLPEEMKELARTLFKGLDDHLKPLLQLGLDYLNLSRSGNTLSTGELQRIQLARTLRTETTGVLYILDEPSIGLHPDNIKGLINVFHQLIAQGNSLVVVDHEVDIISAADWVIEIGPGSGAAGGKIIAQGTPQELADNQHSLIGPFIAGKAKIKRNSSPSAQQLDTADHLNFAVNDYFNLHDVAITIPINHLTAMTGFSGAGKTSLILDSLVPAIKQQGKNERLPKQVAFLDTELTDVVSVDAAPVGKNERSTLATYTTIMNELRRLFAALPAAKEKGYTSSYFSYNNKEGACPNCGGSGTISLDIQYLPDMIEVCPVCHGGRFDEKIQAIKWHDYSITDLLELSVRQALPIFKEEPKIYHQLETLQEIGLDYLHLGESTPALSGGEAQRLKLVKHLHRRNNQTLFVFDEPSVGLHPLDVQTLLEVMARLMAKGATIIMITHDLDLMTNADYLIDLGPHGGNNGGQIMAAGTPAELVQHPQSLTINYLAQHWRKYDLI